MIAIAYYLLKVILCSGILFGYYHLVLRNKLFHQWNRFYLIGSILLSITLPLLQIPVSAPVNHESRIISALEMVSGADEYVREANTQVSFTWNSALLASTAYTLVSLVILAIFILALRRIHQMIRRNHAVAIDDFYFLNTTEPGTPFSYMRFLLWNQDIALDSDTGRRILEHELVHIREKHTWDKLFVQSILVLFWINPVFWLIRRELAIVHEFIADRKTIGDGDAHAFARVLLETSYPGYAPMITQSFFSSSIKRRLAMITRQQHPGLSYISRLMMIPVIFLLLFAFGVKAKTFLNPEHIAEPLNKTVTVLVDAGHGGDDTGVKGGETTEKQLNLAIAQRIKALNRNENIRIILTRETDIRQPLDEKVKLVEKHQADLFVSIHINSAANDQHQGIEAFVASKNPAFDAANQRLASVMLNNLSNVYRTNLQIRQRAQTIYVLDRNICPSVLLELGYLTNQADYQFVTKPDNQDRMAAQVLRSIEDYFNPDIKVSPVIQTDSVPKNKPLTIQVKDTSGKKVTFVYKDGRKETLTREQYQQKTGNGIVFLSDTIFVNGDALTVRSKEIPKDLSYTINGKVASPVEVQQLSTDRIVSVSVNKADEVSGKGSVNITTKDASPSTNIQGKTTTSVQATKVNTTQTIAKDVFNGVSVNLGDKDQVLNLNAGAPPPLIILDGEETSQEAINKMNPNKIARIDVLRGEKAEKTYGEKGRNGVVIITSKK